MTTHYKPETWQFKALLVADQFVARFSAQPQPITRKTFDNFTMDMCLAPALADFAWVLIKGEAHRGFTIEWKRDFGDQGQATRQIGWVVVENFCNAMPGATWFETTDEARKAIDVFLRVKRDAGRFWEILQPFGHKLGSKDVAENGTITQGRFSAVVKNHIVVEVRGVSRDGKREKIERLLGA